MKPTAGAIGDPALFTCEKAKRVLPFQAKAHLTTGRVVK